MKPKDSKFHSLIMFGLGIYTIAGAVLMIYGLINATSRPYVIAFIVLAFLCSAYAAATAPLLPSSNKPQETNS